MKKNVTDNALATIAEETTKRPSSESHKKRAIEDFTGTGAMKESEGEAFDFEELRGNGEYKSDLFSLLMQEKEYALDTYNAVNDSDYDNPEEIQIITLEHGVSLSIRNDASFILDMSANYYEHQSGYNPNMPLRNLLYFAEDIKQNVEKKKRNLYGSIRIKIPTPHFVVFYNGTADRPETEYQKLSESYYKQTVEAELELVCKVININPGKNPEMMSKAKVLTGYTTLVEKVRENQGLGMTLRNAIHKAIDDCIRDGILDEFLKKKRYEVEKTMNLDFTFKRQLELTAEEEYAAGFEAGIQQEKERADALEEEIAKLKKVMSKELKDRDEKNGNLDFTFNRQLELTAEEEYAAGFEAGIQQEKDRANAAEKRADALEEEIIRLKKLLAQ